MLGSDVTGRSENSESLSEITSRVKPLGQTEVADQRMAFIIEKYVSRLKIAMKNAFAMRVFDRARYLSHQGDAFATVVT